MSEDSVSEGDLHPIVKVFGMLAYRVSISDEPEDAEPWTAPVFNVRLDAGSDRNEDRTWRLRVTLAFGAEDHVTEFRRILDIAEEHGLEVRLDNDGIELR